MNILQIANKVPYPPKDGGSIATFNFTKGLAKLGHQMDMLAINTLKHFVDISKITPELQGICTIKGITTNTRISAAAALRNLLFSRMPYNAQRFVTEEFEQAIATQLQHTTYDVVQLEGLYLAPYIRLVRKHSEALISMRSHNVEHEIWQRTALQIRNPLKKWYVNNLSARIKRLETSTFNDFDVMLPITARDAEIFRQLGFQKPMHVTPAGIDISTLQPDVQAMDFPSLFHLGALDWAPNQEGLLWFLEKCWPLLHQQFPQLTFYIAGRNATAAFAKKLQQPGVRYCGEVDDAREFINSKAVMVVPLLSGSGMRIKIIEGMALQKTIVTTATGTEGIPTSNGDNILIANTPEDFISAVGRAVSSRDFCLKLGKNAREFIQQQFDNTAIAQSVADFYTAHISRPDTA